MTGPGTSAPIQAKFPGLQEIPKVQGQARGDELYVAVPAPQLVELCRYLRFDPPLSFDFLSFVTSIDWKTHFEVVYYLVSTLHKHKLVLKVKWRTVRTRKSRPSPPSGRRRTGRSGRSTI